MSNYKVGDKVLVEFEIKERQGHSKERWNAKSKTDQIYGIDDCDIHSLSPEFKPGEEVEVSDCGKYWKKALYYGELPLGNFLVGYKDNFAHHFYNYCRKPQ